MTIEELKKKIEDVLRENTEYELHYFPDDNYTEVEFDYDKLADALIATGLTFEPLTFRIVENKPYSYKVKNKQKHIEEMADIKSVLIKTHKRCRTLQEDYMQNKYAEGIYKAGYRKQSDVIKEFVEKVKDKFFYELDSERSINPVSIYRFTDKEIDELAAEFGVEVEE